MRWIHTRCCSIVRWLVTVIPRVFFLHSTCERRTLTFARGVSRGNVEFHVRTWNSTCARRQKLDMVDVRTWILNSTFARGVSRANVELWRSHVECKKKLAGWPLRATVQSANRLNVFVFNLAAAKFHRIHCYSRCSCNCHVISVG